MKLSIHELTRNIHAESIKPIGFKEARALARKLIKACIERPTAPIKTRKQLRAIIRGNSAHPLTNFISYQTYCSQIDSSSGGPISFSAWSYGTRVINDDLATRRPAKNRWATLKTKNIRPGSLVLRSHDRQRPLRVHAISHNAMVQAICLKTKLTITLSPEHVVLVK